MSFLKDLPLHVIRLGWSIDRTYDTQNESIGFDPERSPVISILDKLWCFATDHRIAWVDSDGLTEWHLEELMLKLQSIRAHTRIIITSGTWALRRIAETIQASKFLIRNNNEYLSTPSIVQAASLLPGFIGSDGDIRDTLLISKAFSEQLGPGAHMIVIWQTTQTVTELISNKYTAPQVPRTRRILY